MKKLFKQKSFFFAILLLAVFALLSAACADVTNIDACKTTEPYGFLGGLWHGIIAPVSFFLSLFMDDVAMYAVKQQRRLVRFRFCTRRRNFVWRQFACFEM